MRSALIDHFLVLLPSLAIVSDSQTGCGAMGCRALSLLGNRRLACERASHHSRELYLLLADAVFENAEFLSDGTLARILVIIANSYLECSFYEILAKRR